MKKIVLVGVLAVTGCATTGAGEGAGVGAGTGAVVGVLAGLALGGSDSAMMKGAALGALVGGAAGYLIGNKMDQERQALRNSNNDLNSQLTAAKGMNMEAQKAVQDMRTRQSQLDNELAGLSQKAQSKRLTLAEQQAVKKKVDGEYSVVSQNLKNVEGGLADLSSAPVAQTPAGNAEIAQLTQYRDELKERTVALASLSQKI